MNLVLDALNSIDPNKIDDEYGICDLVREYIFDHSHLDYHQANSLVDGTFRPLFVVWPEYSGHQIFPVPSPVDHIDAKDYYMMASTATMWSAKHPYGAARRRLLTFLIKELKNAQEQTG